MAPGQPQRRAFLTVGGKTLARHQVDAALAIGCERIICHVVAMSPQVSALQHQIEAMGKAFHTIASPRDIVGLVSANDEIVAFSEGLLVAPLLAKAQVDGGQAVLAQPIETGLPAGFERIDLNHAAAGIIRVPARLAEGLLDLPADCDVVSSLGRIALQSGVKIREIPGAARSGVGWRMVRDEVDAFALDGEWVAHQLGEGRGLSPGRKLAHFGVAMFGSSLLHAGNASRILAIATGSMMALGLALAWLELVIAGFIVCAAAWVVLQAALRVREIEASPGVGGKEPANGLAALSWLFDIELVVLIFLAGSGTSPASFGEMVFAPVMLLLLVRLVPAALGEDWTDWISDMSLLIGLLIIFTLLDFLNVAIRIAAIVLALAALALTSSRRD